MQNNAKMFTIIHLLLFCYHYNHTGAINSPLLQATIGNCHLDVKHDQQGYLIFRSKYTNIMILLDIWKTITACIQSI